MNALRRMGDRVAHGFPQVAEHFSTAFAFTANPQGQTAVTQPQHAVDGLIFRSADGVEVIQARLNWFTFSRLGRYQSCRRSASLAVPGRRTLSSWGPRVRHGWKCVTSIASGFSVAVSGIQGVHPDGAGDCDGDVAAGLPPADAFGDAATGDAGCRRRQRDPPAGGGWHPASDLRHRCDPPAGLPSHVRRDWTTLETLRAIKNNIFFSSITERTEELFQ